MRKYLPIACFFLLIIAIQAEAADENFVKLCRESFKRDFPVSAEKARILPSPVRGLCELHLGLNVVYYAPPSEPDKKGYLLVGEIYTPEGKNITVEARERLATDVVKKLDLSKAIKIGTGPVKVIEFTDPDCPFCRRLERFFAQNPELTAKITRYVFLYPLTKLHPGAEKHARWILCQKEPDKALVDLMIGKIVKPEISEQCDLQSVEEHLSYSRNIAGELGIRGTPFLIAGRTVVSGFNPGLIYTGINRWLRAEHAKNKH
ncbi:protein-disulfide isomerase [Thermodesulfatator indicus DSM 15286]|uniref:Protein-disulfide isomerase n=1 Tax=Thermodesulfatator indicus (strain DSM 15286 / JCM 11887 / CIR29812) TaxID=667014 RepID=F8ACK8_THEID|nr:DsbC family protein [Thermodesulfatator indicus]AEH45783.1 protein-disulfide isomerase [Thermodesulfatator indicus DSM 15286]